MAKVLCIDDDVTVAVASGRVVEFCGHEPVIVVNSIDAALHIRDLQVRAVLVDFMMPRMDGLEVLTVWQEQRPDVRRVLLTAAPHESEVVAAVRSGLVQLLIAKPPGIADIEKALLWL